MTASALLAPLLGLGAAALLFARLPLELLALGLVIAAVLAGWLSPAEALEGFSNPATITVVAMFVISAAVVRTGALAPIERWLAGFADLGLARQLLLLAAVVGPLSAVLSNTAVVAMFIPLVERWCRRQGMAPARMLMPLSFLTVLAGVGTLLGTSTNLVASSLSAQLGYGSFTLLQFTPMAVITYGLGVLVVILVAPHVLPGKPVQPLAAALESDYGIGGYLSELLVTPASPLAGHSLDASQLQHSFDLRVLALIRGHARLVPPLGDRLLQAGDVLVVRARPEGLLALREEEGLELLPDGSVLLSADREPAGALLPAEPAATAQRLDLSVVEAVVPAGSPLLGQSLRELRFAQRTNAAVLAIRRGEELLRDRLGQGVLPAGGCPAAAGP